MKMARLIRNLILMPWLTLSSCMALEPQAEIGERLIKGSLFDTNHHLLRKSGWIIISENSHCVASAVQESKYIYVKESDPSYLIILTYSNTCTLVDVLINKRNNREL
jgi:hypothetical protein